MDLFDNLPESTNFLTQYGRRPLSDIDCIHGTPPLIPTCIRLLGGMKVSVAINIAMGINLKDHPEYKDYRATNPISHESLISVLLYGAVITLMAMCHEILLCKRACQVCAKQRKRTTAGRYVETSFGCVQCKTFLCKTK